MICIDMCVKMVRKYLCILIITVIMFNGVNGGDGINPEISKQGKAFFKNASKGFKKSCMAKNKVPEEKVAHIADGEFIEERGVMCYIACLYVMTNILKNNKLGYEASLRHVELMYHPELKPIGRAAVENCKDTQKNYKDMCEASFWSAKCMYEFSPAAFLFA